MAAPVLTFKLKELEDDDYREDLINKIDTGQINARLSFQEFMRQEKGREHYFFFCWLLTCYSRMFFAAVSDEIAKMPLDKKTFFYFNHLMNEGYARQVMHPSFTNGADKFVDYALEHAPLDFVSGIKYDAIKHIGTWSKEETFIKLAKAIVKTGGLSPATAHLRRYMVSGPAFVSRNIDWIRAGLPTKFLFPEWYFYESSGEKDFILKSYQREEMLESMK